MKMRVLQDVLIASLFLSSSNNNKLFVKAIVSDECLESHDSLYYNDDLSDAKHNLLFSSPTKTQVENITFMNSILDYNAAKGKTQHRKLIELCEEAQGTVCDVYTEVVYNTTQAKTIEIARPLCIPKSCDGEDVKEALDYLYPEPLHCNSNSDENENGCQIVKHEVDCGLNHTAAAGILGGDCLSDKIVMSQNRTISNRQKNIVKRMDEECLEAVHARVSNWCRLEYSVEENKNKIPFTLVRDWTELGGRNYKEFEEACIALNHTVCGVDTRVSFRNAELYEHGRPFCLPSSCQDEDVKLLYPSPLYCESNDEEDKDENDCQIVSQSISCIRDVDDTDTISLDKCIQDFEQTLNDPIIHRKSEQMLERMEGDCLDTLYGDVTSDICKLTSPTILHKARDVSLLPLQDLHTEFEDSCYEAGGAPCKYTVELFSKQKTAKKNQDLSFVNTEYPVCLPKECENERRKDIANTFIFDDLDCNTNQQESTNQECVIRIMNDVCGEYPTPSPTTKPTPIPTPLPTQTQTNHPTKKGLATLIDSQQQGNGGGVPTVMDITSTATTTTTDSPTVDIPVFGSGPTFYSSSSTTSSSSSLSTNNTNAFWRILVSSGALVLYFFVF